MTRIPISLRDAPLTFCRTLTHRRIQYRDEEKNPTDLHDDVQIAVDS